MIANGLVFVVALLSGRHVGPLVAGGVGWLPSHALAANRRSRHLVSQSYS